MGAVSKLDDSRHVTTMKIRYSFKDWIMDTFSEDTYKSLYSGCRLCPRDCGKDRKDSFGVCLEPDRLFIARAALHMWEEPCISGERGSGAVFFSGCPLKCVFCQNHDISTSKVGKEISIERLIQIFFELKEKGANNINLVTPTHYIPHIAIAGLIAKEKGLNIPFVYNTSGYEKSESLDLLKDVVSVFLPDFKYLKKETASKYSKAPDYPDVAKKALEKMVSMVGAPVFDKDTGLIKSGVIVRVLVLPEHTNEAIDIIKYLYETYKDDIYISIMSQYTPIPSILPKDKEYDSLRRKITKREYDKVINAALDLGVKNAFFQEGDVCKESFIPSFDYEGV